MLRQIPWAAAPVAVHDAVNRAIGGPTHRAVDDERGQNSTIAAAIETPTGPRFVKAVRGVGPEMRWLRNETVAGHHVPTLAPPVRFHADVDDIDGNPWLVVVFDQVAGRPADLRPGSTDIGVMARVVDKLATVTAAPGTQPMRDRWASTDWWDKALTELPAIADGFTDTVNPDVLQDWTRRAPEAVDGDTYAHTDLHADQVRIHAGGVHVLDWGWPAAAAPWLDTAYLIIRLMAAGHPIDHAEGWATRRPQWTHSTPDAVTAWAVYVAGLWTYRAVEQPRPGRTRLAGLARAYAAHRLAA